MDIIVGTAGHIDHGKTALVKALTGTDTDRLPEEKQRGITIDLGFAELKDDEIHFGFVDVPGHERFVKTMVAGSVGIDLVILAIAADEGIMPQTREHFDICRMLQIKSGVVALTKSDLVDQEFIEIVRSDVTEMTAGSFLARAPIIPVSSKTGKGIDHIKLALREHALRLERRSDHLIARLPVDRSFSMKGFGPVVTGTLWSGTIAEGDELELLPAKTAVRVRGIQAHGRRSAVAMAGRRTALNLTGVVHTEVRRGMLLAEPHSLEPAQILYARVEMLDAAARPLISRQRVRLHLGTAEVLARVAVIGSRSIEPGRTGFVQLRSESPVTAVLGDRFVLRSYSPQLTIAGGSILRPAAERVRGRDRLELRDQLDDLFASIGEPVETLNLLIRRAGTRGAVAPEIRAVTGWTKSTFQMAARELTDDGRCLHHDGVYISAESFGQLENAALAAATELHASDRLAKAVRLDALRAEAFRFVRPEIERAVLSSLSSSGKLSVERESAKLGDHKMQLSAAEAKALDHMRVRLNKAGLQVPKFDEVVSDAASASGIEISTARALLHQLITSGDLVRVNADLCMTPDTLDDLVDRLRSFAGSLPDRLIDVSDFKRLSGVSRKYAIPLLEYLDQRKVTVRRGERRFVL